MRTSEARKREEQAALHAAEHERKREVTQQALEAIMSGASFDDADAFVLALEDAGGAVVLR